MTDDTNHSSTSHQLPLNGLEAPGPLPDELFKAVLNAPSPADLPALAAQIRQQGLTQVAADRLAPVVNPRARRPWLGGLLRRRYSPDQRRNALRMIRLLQKPVDVEPFIEAMYDRRHEDIRIMAARTLGQIGLWLDWSSPDMAHIVHALTVAVRHQHAGVRIAAAQALGQLSAHSAHDALMAQLDREEDPRVRDALALALGSMQSADAFFTLLDSYEEGEITAEACIAALANLGEPAVEPLLAAVRRWNVRLISRQMAARALGRMGHPAALDPLLEIVRRPHEPTAMRVTAVEALAELGMPEARAVLVGVYREPGISDELRIAVRRALDHLKAISEGG